MVSLNRKYIGTGQNSGTQFEADDESFRQWRQATSTERPSLVEFGEVALGIREQHNYLIATIFTSST